VIAGASVYWSEGGVVRRAATDGSGAIAVGRVPSPITHLAISASGRTLYALAPAGLFSLVTAR